MSLRLGVVVLASNPSTQKLMQENHKFEVNLGYTVSGLPSKTLSQTQQNKTEMSLKSNCKQYFG
jgi:hypothetical protein